MTTRWDVTKAVRASDLPSPSRLIMLVLADVAEVGTAEIPEKFTPSLTVLARETGLSRSTVQTYLSRLEESGWITRTRPVTPEAMWRGDRVRYRLSIPEGVPVDGTGVARELDQGIPTDGPGVYRELDGGIPTAGPLETDPSDLSDLDQIKPRPDVEEICRYLADKVVANGSRRPRITREWRRQARLLIDKDQRTVEQVKRAIDWSQADPFWKANVLSMPTLREKYDQLRLAAQRPNGRASPMVEREGLRLKPETAANLANRAKWEAIDAVNEQKAIGS